MLPTIIRKRNYTSPSIFDEFFNDSYLPGFFEHNSKSNGLTSPAVNVEENDKEYRIEVAAPGLEKEDLHVSIDDDVLTIKAEKKEDTKEGKDNYIRREFGFSSFSRAFTLPDEVEAEKITAKHKNGVLKVTLPKAEVKVAPIKEVKIS